MMALCSRSLLVVTIFVALAGCGGATPQGSSSIPAASQSGVTAPAQMRARGLANLTLLRSPVRTDRRGSWMASDAKKKSLLYAADEDTGDVYVYSYPKGKLEGTLTGFNLPSGMCTNKAGDIFILNGGGTTVEVFAHGGTSPIRTLDLPGYPELNCSVDRKTGNLALGVLYGAGGEIAVFAGGQGTPTTYEPSGQDGIPGCGYDNRGNLFCDAYGSDGDKFVLFELAKGSSTVTTVSVSGTNGLRAGPMQWDGKYLAFGSGAAGTLYQIALSGSTGSIEGSTQLDGTGWVWQFWIAGARVVAPTYAGSGGAEVGYWNYPAGGDATKTITGFYQPDGATISR
jgi:hypothetical protein